MARGCRVVKTSVTGGRVYQHFSARENFPLRVIEAQKELFSCWFFLTEHFCPRQTRSCL